MLALLVLLFVLSGLAGLIYESIWSRYLGLFVGHSAYAQILVLVIFMGGMALGALAVGRRSERIREPLLAYAAVEAIVGILGLLFHPLYVAVTGMALDRVFPALAGTPWLPVVKWGLAGLLILPQSTLLGATFPLMSAGVIRRAPEEPGRRLGLLYFANSLGAAAGVLISGFVLVGAVGLPGTVAAAGALNLLVAGAVLAALRWERAAKPGSTPVVAPQPGMAPVRRAAPREECGAEGSGPLAARGPGLARMLLVVSFGTAVASFIYEIAWIRMLSLVLSSATHAFEVMLSAFILGLALGAAWVQGRADRWRSPLRALGILQWTMGTLALATLPIYLASFHWTVQMMHGLPGTDAGYRVFTLARYGICLAIMLPATFCAGATLPIITRTMMAAGSGERAIGFVYGVNTLGAILGAALSGIALMPLLGLKGLLIFGALVDIALGVAILVFDGRRLLDSRRLAMVAVPLAAVAALAAVLFVRFDRHLMLSGVYRRGDLLDPKTAEILYYRDGRTATVGVWHSRENGAIVLATNGKPDASLTAPWLVPEGQRPRTVLRADDGAQVLLALITLAHAPRARTAMVVGQGSGMSSHTLLGSPHLQMLETVEIEPDIIHASRRFLPANRRVFSDPRSRFVIDDAKSHLATSSIRYDLILSEPSNPWVSGVAGLFSTEFDQRVAQHLSPEGIFGQWLQLYEINDDLVLSWIAAVHQRFRFYEIFLVDAGNALIVATNRASGLVPDWSIVHYPAIAGDLRHLPPFSSGAFEAMRVTNRLMLAPLIEGGIVANSDYYPTLDLGAERARFKQEYADGLAHLHGDRFALTPMALGRALGPSPTPFLPAPDIPRLRFLWIGAALRLPVLPAGVDPDKLDPRFKAGLERRARFSATLASGAAPSDWRAWTFEAIRTEEDLDMGTAGFADEAFFGALRTYMERTGAPAEARNAIEFVHSVAVWDLEDAARRSDALVALAGRGQDWVPVETLLDGVVAARLLTGDRDGARSAYQVLLPRSRRTDRDLSSRLMVAHFGGRAAAR